MPRLAELRGAGMIFDNLDTGEALGDRQVDHRERLPRLLGHRRGARSRRRHRHHRTDDRRRRSCSARRRGTTAGAQRLGPSRRRHASPGTSSSAGPRRPAATTRSSRRCPGSSGLGSRSPRLRRTASSVITKHPGTWRAQVSVGTVTAQLLYEIGGPRYLNPDVDDEVRHDPARAGGARPGAHVGRAGRAAAADGEGVHQLVGGYRERRSRSMLTGLDIEEKAALAERALWSACPRAARTRSTRSTCS